MYVLVIYSTFLTRSGVLGDASVHSFVNPGMMVYMFLIIFVGTFLCWELVRLLIAGNILPKINDEENIFQRTLLVYRRNCFMRIGYNCTGRNFRSYIRTFSRYQFLQSDAHSYCDNNRLLKRFKPSAKMENYKKGRTYKEIIIFSCRNSGGKYMIVLFGGISDIMVILLALSATFALIVNLEIAVKIIRGNKKMLGAYVAHIGIALFILGVIGSSIYTREKDMNLIKNVP